MARESENKRRRKGVVVYYAWVDEDDEIVRWTNAEGLDEMVEQYGPGIPITLQREVYNKCNPNEHEELMKKLDMLLQQQG